MSTLTSWSLTFFLIELSGVALSIDPIVTISNGEIRGRTALTVGAGITYYAYQGIPYAEPPIGNLRFAPPVAKGNWSGILNTTQDGSACVQSTNPIIGSEDCLFINVYTTEAPGSTASLSTMVFIPGGGYIVGDAKYKNNAPDYLLEEGVVFVAIQYRLGIFGFLSLSDTVAPGNYGMKDQVMALKWVRDNIANFGGNPNDVTLFGQSAGASSVSYHRQSPLSQGLFHKVIMDSGVTLNNFALCSNVPKLVQDTAVALGVSTLSSTATIQGLREVDYSELQKTSLISVIGTVLFDSSLAIGFCPVIEPVHSGAFITEPSRQMLLNGNFEPVPALVGYNSMEGSLEDYKLNVLRPIFLQWELLPGKLVPAGMHVTNLLQLREIGKLIRNRYFGTSLSTMSDDKIITFLSDHLFNRPIRQYIKLTHSSANVYFYIFGYRGQMGGNLNTNFTGAAHFEELRYIFVSRFSSTDSADITVRNQMVAMWTNFAKYGNPTPTVKQNVLEGITWTPSNTNLTHLSIDTDVLMAGNPEQSIMEYWDELFEEYENPPFDTY